MPASTVDDRTQRRLHRCIHKLDLIPALDREHLENAAWPIRTGEPTGGRSAAGSRTLGYAHAEQIADDGSSYFTNLAAGHDTALRKLADADRLLAGILGRRHVTTAMLGNDTADMRRRCVLLAAGLRTLIGVGAPYESRVADICSRIDGAHQVLVGGNRRRRTARPAAPAKRDQL